ncbi:MAG: sulfite exporter TauE/SafE family protein [Gaiella sp.]
MSTTTVVLAVTLGLVAGVLAGTFGVGGGILFVPTLVALGLGQVEAGATSLLAIVPTAAMGVVRQRQAGLLRPRDAIVIGVTSFVGVEAGVQIATRLDDDLLRRLFGVLLLAIAAQLAWRSWSPGRRYPEMP